MVHCWERNQNDSQDSLNIYLSISTEMPFHLIDEKINYHYSELEMPLLFDNMCVREAQAASQTGGQALGP